MLKIVKQNKAVETMQIECTEVCSTERPFAKDFCKYNVCIHQLMFNHIFLSMFFFFSSIYR